eukprot:CAMPEP_0194103046 /NCGR_PEP_ID=MMETSP0150-20130528/3550_1 /TAXON_ID=122233 /ORGANISM="Chaetoceros debilis, Strain MM31A-1" /LENGTH=1228 /DNA_ID=CAMNT_0038790173 /DNA_START=105 /DNA_END=3792 /DNA_ORIENTATION=+
MIPNTINANLDDEGDNDSLSDDEEVDFAAIQQAALHFQGGRASHQRGSRQSRPSISLVGPPSSDQSNADIRLSRRTSYLSKDESAVSNDGSASTILRTNANTRLRGGESTRRSSFAARPRQSFSSYFTPPVPAQDPYPPHAAGIPLAESLHNMSQIDECCYGDKSEASNSLSTANSTGIMSSRNSYSVGMRRGSTRSLYQMSDEENEVEQFTSALPREVQRLSAMRRQSFGRLPLNGGAGRRPSVGARRSSIDARRPSLDARRPSLDTRRPSIDAHRASLDVSAFQTARQMSGSSQQHRPSRKRRSCAETESGFESAAAQVAQMFADGLLDSDDDEDMSSSLRDSSRSHSRRNSGRSTLSGANSLNYGFGAEERPRKRLSASSNLSFRGSIGASSMTEDHYRSSESKPYNISSLRESFATLEPIAGSSTSAMSAACAVVAADEASRTLQNRLSLHQVPNHNMDVPEQHYPPRQKFQRRAGFVVSTLEREAMKATSDRMRRLEMDRIESRCRSQRRSMSYTTGIKMKSSIIGSCVHEDTEIVDEVAEAAVAARAFEEDQNFQRLTRSRMERRVLSMPDPNAISRLSETSFKSDIDFSSHRSALSATLEASSGIARESEQPISSLPGLFDNDTGNIFPTAMNTNYGIGLNDFNNPMEQAYPSYGISDSSLGARGRNSGAYSTDASSQTFPSYGLGNSSIGARRRNSGAFSIDASHRSDSLESLSSTTMISQIAAELKNIQLQSAVALQANAIVAQTISQTQEASIILQKAEMLLNAQTSLPNTPRSIHHSFTDMQSPPQRIFNDDEFDGKSSHIVSIPAASPEYNDAATLLHEACKKDDVQVIQQVLQSCPLSTRIVINGSESGDVAIHIATRSESNAAVKTILSVDRDCALIRNNVGNVALHVAVSNGDLSIVTSITSLVPESAQIQCEEGLLPLHDAVSYGKRFPDTPQIITMIQHRFVDGVFVTSDEGLLPIHLATSAGFAAGLRTLLSSEFSTISSRDKLENMLPLDVAVQELEQLEIEESPMLPVSLEHSSAQRMSSTSENEDTRQRIIVCIEILLSSMYYNRLISSPRENQNLDYPFLPLHSAIRAYPLHKTMTVLFSLYREEFSFSLDPLGRNIAHAICSREIDDIHADIDIANQIPAENFLQMDNYGFIPLHLSLQNPNASYEFVKTVANRNKSSLSREVASLRDNRYSHFVPFQIATAAKCDLDIIYFLIEAIPLEFTSYQ